MRVSRTLPYARTRRSTNIPRLSWVGQLLPAFFHSMRNLPLLVQSSASLGDHNPTRYLHVLYFSLMSSMGVIVQTSAGTNGRAMFYPFSMPRLLLQGLNSACLARKYCSRKRLGKKFGGNGMTLWDRTAH